MRNAEISSEDGMRGRATAHGFVRGDMPNPDRRVRLAPAVVKAMMRERGWNNITLGDWWGCRAENISRIVHNPERKRHYDDAFRALPHYRDVAGPGECHEG